jgi:ligand-binding sensor domain-containing protein
MYDQAAKKIKTIRPPETGFYTIRVMTSDQDGNVLLGLHNGTITTWEKKTHLFHKSKEPLYTEKAQKREILNILVDDQNRCWAATGSCLKAFDIHQHRFIGEYMPDDIDPSLGITVKGIEIYDDSTLIIASVYHGIYLFDKNKHTFTKPFPQQILPDLTTHAVKKDKGGNIWISSSSVYTNSKMILPGIRTFSWAIPSCRMR